MTTILPVKVYLQHIRRSLQNNSDSRRSRSSSSSCCQFSIDEIRSATNRFDAECVIGNGGFGRVYKGSIDGSIVAIKRLKSESRQGEKEFQSEIRMLSKLRHEHVVPLVGYCNDGEERVLVYKYMAGGTLEDHLHKLRRRGVQNPPLSWEQRLKISIGAAHGLYFLHTSKRRVVHRDVKSSNILLDENWVAKLSDFGRCIDEHPRERPAMADVVVSLELALRLQQNPSSGQEFDEEVENINAARSYSDQSNGVFSFNDLSVDSSREETAQNGTNEVPGTSPETEEPETPKSTSSRLWWDIFGLFSRSASKGKASSSVPVTGLHIFSVKKILNATNNFHHSSIIGFRGCDSIYKGHINGVKLVAVRQSRKQTDLRTTLADDLVSFFGYFQQGTETLFVYESVANGSLHDHLSDPNKDHLPWKRRLQICIGIAKGLFHHQSTVKQTNLHCTLKSTNILLDNNWAAMIPDSDASARRVINDARALTGGNEGWMDSDYLRDDKAVEKSYIFSFGLMLFEVLCSTKGSRRWLDEGQVSLAQWIKTVLRTNYVSGCIDPYLMGKMSQESFDKFVESASKCLLDQGVARPSMDDIVAGLEDALKLQEAAEDA